MYDFVDEYQRRDLGRSVCSTALSSARKVLFINLSSIIDYCSLSHAGHTAQREADQILRRIRF